MDIYQVKINWLNTDDYHTVYEDKGFYATKELAEKAKAVVDAEYKGMDAYVSYIITHKLHT